MPQPCLPRWVRRRWRPVTNGTEPPASRIPSVAKGTLVPPLPQEGQGFPKLKNVTYNGRMHTGDPFGYGPEFSKGDHDPAAAEARRHALSALVPKTDSDGNDMAGRRLPDIRAPIATYTGWALRAEPAGANDGCDGAGQMIPLAKTKAERTANDDPRPSLEGRYPTHEAYVNAGAAGGKRARGPAVAAGRGRRSLYAARRGVAGRKVNGPTHSHRRAHSVSARCLPFRTGSAPFL